MPRGVKGVKIKVGRVPTRTAHDQRVQQVPSGNQAIESTITKYCGTDYLERLESITGSITYIDMDVYKDAITRMSTCEKNIRILLKRLLKQSLGQQTSKLSKLIEDFSALCSTYDLANKSIILKPKKGVGKGATLTPSNSREVIAPDYSPLQIAASDWFKTIKAFEREVYHIIEKVFISPDGEARTRKTSKERKEIKDNYTYDKYEEVIKKYPNVRDLYKFFNIKITNNAIFDTLLDIQKYACIVINIMLTPMYDVRAKIDKSYDKNLSFAFKSMVSNGTLTKDIVINLLTDFMIAKYRSTVTGSQKYFIQMLSDELTEGQLAHCNAAEFVSIMDTIKLEELDSKSKVVDFTIKAKELMKRMVERGETTLDVAVIKDVKELLGDDGETKTEEKTTVLMDLPGDLAKHISKFDDILDDADEITITKFDSPKPKNALVQDPSELSEAISKLIKPRDEGTIPTKIEELVEDNDADEKPEELVEDAPEEEDSLDDIVVE